MTKVSKSWFVFYLIAALIAIVGPGWMLVSAILTLLLLVMDACFSFWYKYSKSTTDKLKDNDNAFSVSNGATTAKLTSNITFLFYFLTFWRALWVFVACFVAFFTISSMRIVLLPLFPPLIYNMTFRYMWVMLFTIIFTVGLVLSSICIFCKRRDFIK